MTPHGNTFKFGAGATYEEVDKRELDGATYGFTIDSLRAYRAFAPGGFAYAQGRWLFEGMVANAGIRGEYFTPGPQAGAQSTPGVDHAIWSLSPRLGIAYPISVRDVFSLSYVRIQEDPRRDLLYDSRHRISNRQPLGNPALVPATAISYQAALKHLMPPQLSLQAAVFFRDVWGLVGARNIQPAADVPILRYDNADEAGVMGTEFTLVREAGDDDRIEIDYTWQVARGTYSREDGVPFGPLLLRRPESVGDHALDWDRRHTISLAGIWHVRGGVTVSWSGLVGSPLPWTPAQPRTDPADLSQENTRRLSWDETTNAAVRCALPRTHGRLVVGLDVRNLFDHRSELAATLDGYPNPVINTRYDDYGAYRTETGLGGGAYYGDANGDGHPGWVPVHDPRLLPPPRSVRLTLDLTW